MSSSFIYFFPIICNYITSNSKSISFYIGFTVSPLCVFVWHTVAGLPLWGVISLEIPPPSGGVPFPLANSLCQWHQLLQGTSWQKQWERSHFQLQHSTSATHCCFSIKYNTSSASSRGKGGEFLMSQKPCINCNCTESQAACERLYFRPWH